MQATSDRSKTAFVFGTGIAGLSLAEVLSRNGWRITLIDNAPDRVLWGTDWPHPNVKIMPNDGEIVDLIPLYVPDAAVQHKLLVDNPTRLFGFAPL